MPCLNQVTLFQEWPLEEFLALRDEARLAKEVEEAVIQALEQRPPPNVGVEAEFKKLSA